MYSRGSIVAGVLGTIASAGWILQGVGIGFYYRQVESESSQFLSYIHMTIRFGHIITLPGILWHRCVSITSCVFQHLTVFYRQGPSWLSMVQKRILREDDQLGHIIIYIHGCMYVNLVNDSTIS